MTEMIAPSDSKCVNCKKPAYAHISWVARLTETKNIPQECPICETCLDKMWEKSKNATFGQTFTIRELDQA